jgi:murein DD-endopeptidase MepM/ murein hydrolase activator NlpD
VHDAASSGLSFAADSTVQQNHAWAGRGATSPSKPAHGNALKTLTARWSPEDDGMFKRLTIDRNRQWLTCLAWKRLPMTVSSRLSGGIISIHHCSRPPTRRAFPIPLPLQLADIFSGDVDFHRALRKGDRFAVTYETLEGDGEPLRAGRVLNAEFVNAGKTFQAMWFQDPVTSGAAAASTASHTLTKGAYYTLAGESLRKAFLASPMEFSRVSSGFKMRFHPILQTWRAHLGVDYAAPTGTAVRSVGDGTVEFSGVQNGFGNVVIVKHRNNSTTVYAHLSRINVRTGQSISQGQNVGAVGQTGWATGPHLHFEFRVNGAHVDPLTIARQSESTPVAASAKPAFNRAAAQVRAQLTAAAYMLPGSAQ